MKPIKYNNPVYWFSNIIIKDKKNLQRFLDKNNIQTRNMFLPLNKQPCFNNLKNIKNLKTKFPISEKIYNHCISLPSSYNLNKNQLLYIVNKIKIFLNIVNENSYCRSCGK